MLRRVAGGGGETRFYKEAYDQFSNLRLHTKERSRFYIDGAFLLQTAVILTWMLRVASPPARRYHGMEQTAGRAYNDHSFKLVFSKFN